jgi:hypothetical protein
MIFLRFCVYLNQAAAAVPVRGAGRARTEENEFRERQDGATRIEKKHSMKDVKNQLGRWECRLTLFRRASASEGAFFQPFFPFEAMTPATDFERPFV